MKSKILLIDDEESFFRSFSLIMRDQPVEIMWAADAKSGIQAFKNLPHGFATVIIDYVLPDLKGSEVCQCLRKINPRQDFLFTSGHRTVDVLGDIVETGTDGFLPKGQEPGMIRERVLRSIAKYQQETRIIGSDDYLYLFWSCCLRYSCKEMLRSPVRPRHKQMAYIREPNRKPDDKKIPVEAAFKLFSALPELYRDLAMTQFYCAGRIGEITGIQIQNIYFDQEFILIKDSVVWTDVNKTFSYLKPFPKNRDTRRVHLHVALREIIDRRMKLRFPGCDYLFHVEGKPLNYCTIQSNYKSAQSKVGIPYSGTHCLRHGMATLARKVGAWGLIRSLQ